MHMGPHSKTGELSPCDQFFQTWPHVGMTHADLQPLRVRPLPSGFFCVVAQPVSSILWITPLDIPRYIGGESRTSGSPNVSVPGESEGFVVLAVSCSAVRSALVAV